MKKYQHLLFDLDDTLLDFGAAEDLALHRLFEEQKIPLTEEVEEKYRQINSSLWTQFEHGEITRDEVITTRFAKLFAAYDQGVDGVLFDTKYRNYLAESKVFVKGAWEIVNELARQFDLYLVTNGVSVTQYKRLQVTGLAPFFKNVFVSEDTGYQKPMKGYFDYVFERIPNFRIEEALIIGDSFSADIVGGIQAGIDTCWFNQHGKAPVENYKPKYEIAELQQLAKILL
ncbi:YjjG family noncanonical pyrimidine nucleotidase [Metasolibacillus sp.]|uniref:YjjG family noncanonical pyrimidine nucleotidase n=1 Tax=Metasolibacillus sp. TaxID=2703680 RepID=UPI0025DA1190|nr:YjjG family noncanonical pyrimidine nucleotidase [Metasolibacillus sp.]MCT6923818.1 YjjG family noncanonical pyrimidine nucleotidase [Metasolibacillus sp.]MCT6939949.1 YjjG family noncanonical pyrimidine nucleotidase [Metasolibacillus sp.]